MPFVLTNVTLTDFTTKWGLVVVADAAGVIVKQYEITPAEAKAVHDGKALPPGIDKQTWETGNVYVCSRPCLARQAVMDTGGWIVVNASIDKTIIDKIGVRLFRIPPTQWELRGSELWIDSVVAAQLG